MSETWRMPWWTGAIMSRSSPSPRRVLEDRLSTGPSPYIASGRLPSACPTCTATRPGPMRCRSWTLAFGARSARILAARHFDIVHAHDWSIGSVIGPARNAGVPVVLTQHDYSHVCATKRLMRGGDVCPGPAPIACVRCASSRHGPARRPWHRARRTSSPAAPAPDTWTRSSRSAQSSPSARDCPDGAPTPLSPTSFPTSSRPRRAHPESRRTDRVRRRSESAQGHRSAASKRTDCSVDFPTSCWPDGCSTDTPLDLPDQVELRGLLDHASVIDLMRTACVVAVPSIVPDCCPTVVLEAMAVGRPVVAAASGGIVDLVDHGVTGLLVAPGDPVDLSAALSAVVERPRHARRRWGERHSTGHGCSPHRRSLEGSRRSTNGWLSGLPPAN